LGPDLATILAATANPENVVKISLIEAETIGIVTIKNKYETKAELEPAFGEPRRAS